jgi:uncharacterized protein
MKFEPGEFIMWKEHLREFVDGFKHPAWGLSHSTRVYEMALHLAQEPGTALDEDALLAAAYLHDLGALGSYWQPGMDHAERSVQVVGDILAATDYPPEKVPLVKDIILGHTFQARPTSPLEAVLFHDADILDFMGYIGVTRLLSLVGKHDWAPDPPGAVGQIRRFSRQMPALLLTPQAQDIGQSRLAEMEAYLSGLAAETDNLKAL